MQKEYKTRHERVGNGIHCELSTKLEFDYSTKWYKHKPETVPENKLLWDFRIQRHHLILERTPDLVIVDKKKKRSCRIMNFIASVDNRGKIKENGKGDKSLDPTREARKLWKMKVTVIPILIGALGMIPKGWIRELDDLEITWRAVTIQTKAILRSVRILRRLLATWEYLLSLRL